MNNELEIISLIIDRVGKTNIFNVIQGRLPESDSHLQSILDEDLILEFLSEIERIYRLSHSLEHKPKNTNKDSLSSSINLLNMLRVTGETFFEQFFPEIIQKKIRETNSAHFFLNLDPALANIPWEILHDGNLFLGDKFSLGKNIKGVSDKAVQPESHTLNMLIIADPTEELEWAKKEGEELFDSLSSKISGNKLKIEYIGGSQITKLRLLNELKGKDIIHYCGHLHYSADNQEENGWLLFNNKVLHAREIQKSGAKPTIVFSNSCLPRKIRTAGDLLMDPSSDIASSFLSSGISNYIGTLWEIPDTKRTLDFTIKFYEDLFSGSMIGEALLSARNYARRNFSKNDLTWANYTLYGNPVTKIYKESGDYFDIASNTLNVQTVINSFPTPIALSYKTFIDNMEDSSQHDLENMFSIFENTMLILGSVIFGSHRFHNLKERPDFELKKDIHIKRWVELIYEALYDLQSLKLPLISPALSKTLYIHRDMIYKLVSWLQDYEKGSLEKSSIETYLVTFQYLLENLLMDSYFLQDFQLFYLFPDETEHLLFKGCSTSKTNIFLPETENTSLQKKISKSLGELVLFDPIQKGLVSLSPFAHLSFHADGKGSFEFLNYKGLRISNFSDSL